jgi:hypothetical protein
VGEHPHRRAIAAGAVALLLGFVLALILAGGEDDQPPGTTPTEPPATTETVTETGPAPGETVRRPPPARDFVAIQAAVTLLVESAELGDAAGVCRALGQPRAGSGPEAAQRCADRAGIDLQALPGSDELSFEDVTASGNRGTARLSTGDTVRLRRQDGRWVVTGIAG